MNARARRSRRILREHRRTPGLYWHVNRSWHTKVWWTHQPWVCPRCGYVREYPGE